MFIDEMIAVLQAIKDKKAIEYRVIGVSEWRETHAANLNFCDIEYRVKPEPKVLWVNEHIYGAAVYTEKFTAIKRANGDITVLRTAVRYVEQSE